MSVNIIIYSFWATLRVIVKLQKIIFINWHVDYTEQICIHSNNVSGMCLIINSNHIKLEFIIWYHTSAHLYIVILLEFSLEWIYLSVIRNYQGVGNNPGIKIDFKSKCAYIVRNSVELLFPHCHGLDGPGLEKRSKIIDEAATESGGVLCLLSFLRLNTQAPSIPHFTPLCCICVIPHIYLYIGLFIL